MRNQYDDENGNPENSGDWQELGSEQLNNYMENRSEILKDIARAYADEGPMEFESDNYRAKLREEKENREAREKQEKQERRSKIICILLLCCLSIIAVLPQIIMMISSGEGFFTVFIGIIFVLGRLILSWFALGVAVTLLLIVSMYFYNLVISRAFDDNSIDDNNILSAVLLGLTAAFMIVIVYYFLTTWKIVPAFMSSVLGFIFPKLATGVPRKRNAEQRELTHPPDYSGGCF